jgi:ADP-ribose pyrophosphatase YjhB (NUDIX family)
MTAANRELAEETGLADGAVLWASSPFTTTDAIYFDDEEDSKAVRFHYLIAQTFAALQDGAPDICAGDDAMAVRWWTLEEVAEGARQGEVVGNCGDVLSQAEALYAAGLLEVKHLGIKSA